MSVNQTGLNLDKIFAKRIADSIENLIEVKMVALDEGDERYDSARSDLEEAVLLLLEKIEKSGKP